MSCEERLRNYLDEFALNISLLKFEDSVEWETLDRVLFPFLQSCSAFEWVGVGSLTCLLRYPFSALALCC